MPSLAPVTSLPSRGAWIEIALADQFGEVPVGRSPRGERGLKWHLHISMQLRLSRRSPRGERGLKWLSSFSPSLARSSLPSRGAWIEIPKIAGRPRRSCRRSPRGERGLKCQGIRGAISCGGSLPSRGAWIEIADRQASFELSGVSLPSRGAWIEMERCLSLPQSGTVAPLAGSVD